MKAYVGLEVLLHSFLTLAVEQDKQSASSYGQFTPVESTPCTCVTGGWVGPKVVYMRWRR
jgi:hypothetical protein